MVWFAMARQGNAPLHVAFQFALRTMAELLKDGGEEFVMADKARQDYIESFREQPEPEGEE